MQPSPPSISGTLHHSQLNPSILWHLTKITFSISLKLPGQASEVHRGIPKWPTVQGSLLAQGTWDKLQPAHHGGDPQGGWKGDHPMPTAPWPCRSNEEQDQGSREGKGSWLCWAAWRRVDSGHRQAPRSCTQPAPWSLQAPAQRCTITPMGT